MPSFIILFNAAAFSFPRVASVMGLGWILARMWYTVGYSTKGPSGRKRGANLAFLTMFGLVIRSQMDSDVVDYRFLRNDFYGYRILKGKRVKLDG